MREKYESLAVSDLKEIAKSRGIKGISAMKKADVVEAMLRLDEQEKKEKETENGGYRENSGKTEGNTGVGKSEPAGRSENTVRAERNYRNESSGRGDYSQRNENGGRTDYSQRNENSGRMDYSQRNENGGRTDYSQRNENGGRTDYSQRNENGGRTDYSQRNENGGRADYSQRNENGGRTDYSQRNENGGRGDSAARNEGTKPDSEGFLADLDSGQLARGILEVMSDGFGFIRCANYLPGENDVYVAPSQIRRFNLKTGDFVEGNTRIKTQNEKFSALLYVKSINGYHPEVASRRKNFEDMTPIFPEERLKMERYGNSVAMRIVDLLSPVGKGQRGMIVSPPKAGKTTLLKEVAKSVKMNNPDLHLIILLIDERPEEVTDFREAIEGPNVEVIYSTFDELPEHHKRVAEMVMERAKRLVEHKKDVMILLDSITRLTRAYNLVVPPSGRTLSGGLDPAALHMPKRFFGAARNMREGGSLTILATALVDTGSKMDDVIYEEFKGTGNMELVLDRKLSERRVFPAIDIPRSSTRREDLLLSQEELEAINILRKALNSLKPEEAVDRILDMYTKTRNNVEFVNMVKRTKFF